ncbi:unnamed protein product [Dracunculus medinensis]|uniref:HTH psq-type domain-containing protein n=1 Tax=Dracunculus medinensis TaxID=318479 RepID=A0A0N4U3U1_DRAME|nr:unnamed protein product [Dracunculus medinensis]
MKRLRGDLLGDENLIKKRKQSHTRFTPFKPIKLPEAWKYECRKMQESIRYALSNCQYSDPERKERLFLAVMDALSGKKTIKGAAITHNVVIPCTTLQVYFHRSRLHMEKLMNDHDSGIAEQIEIPVSLSLFGSLVHDDSSANEIVAPRENLALSSVSVDSCECLINKASCSKSLVRTITGSKKRKPKSVHRFIPEPYFCLDPETEKQNYDEFFDTSKNIYLIHMSIGDNLRQLRIPNKSSEQIFAPEASSLDNNDLNSRRTQNNSPYIRNAIAAVLSFSNAPNDVKNRLKWAIMDIQRKKLTIEQACYQYHLLNDCLIAYNQMVEKIVDEKDKSGQSCGNNLEEDCRIIQWSKFKIADKNRCEVGLPLDPKDHERKEKIENCVASVCQASVYPMKMKVICGEQTISAAAYLNHLPISTVYTYVSRARIALSGILPPQITGSSKLPKKLCTRDRNEELMVNNSRKMNEIDKMLTLLLENSNFNETYKQKIFHATLMEPFVYYIFQQVICGSIVVSIIEGASLVMASKLCGVPINSFNFYVQKIRYNLQLSSSLNKISQKENMIVAKCDSTRANISVENFKMIETPSNSSSTPIERTFLLSTANTDTIFRSKKIGQLIKRKNIMNELRPSNSDSCSSPPYEFVCKNNQHPVDDEYELFQNVAHYMCEDKFDEITSMDINIQPRLKEKIYVILRYYNYTGNHDDMCNALLEVFVERKNCDEASSSKTFSSRTLSTYVRLVKALLIAVNKELSDEQSLKLQICETDMDEMMKDNDIMLIHSKSILNSLEHSIKLIISYLVEHRCHQSQDLQEKRQRHALSFEKKILKHQKILDILTNSLSEKDFRKKSTTPSSKLNAINFPIENRLIIGLAKEICSKLFIFPEKMNIPDTVWNEWATLYRQLHPEPYSMHNITLSLCIKSTTRHALQKAALMRREANK